MEEAHGGRSENVVTTASCGGQSVRGSPACCPALHFGAVPLRERGGCEAGRKAGLGESCRLWVVMGSAQLGTAGTSEVSGSGEAHLTPATFMRSFAAASELGQVGS